MRYGVHRFRLGALAALVALTACTDSSGSGAPCTATNECPLGQRCVDRQCQLAPERDADTTPADGSRPDDADAPDSSTLDARMMDADANKPACTEDDDCASLICGGGACQPARCGDGIINREEEQCDEAGDTDRCDADCTQVECGDGRANAAANEECDTEGPSSECDADCTLVTCGDGTLNEQAGEVCDDGNRINTDLCSRECRPTTCADGLRNGDEAAPDCGGRCGSTCHSGQPCRTSADCVMETDCIGEVCQLREILVSAHRHAHTGALGGLAGADALCAADAAAAGFQGTWIALLSATGSRPRNWNTLLSGHDLTVPVVNTHGETMFANWALTGDGTDGDFPVLLYAFSGNPVNEGNAVGGDEWRDADAWTGTGQDGAVVADATCTNWTVTTGVGKNTELDLRKLHRNEQASCDVSLALMCIRTGL